MRPELFRIWEVAFPAYFLLLLLSVLRSSDAARWIALVGGLIAVGVVYVGPTGLALLAASVAALMAMLWDRSAADE